MLFTDVTFLFYFLPVALILLRVTTSFGKPGEYNNLSRLTLFGLTLFFYGYQHPWWLVPFLICIAFDFLWANLLSRSTDPWVRKVWLSLSIVQNLSLLAIFKYREMLLA